MISTDNRVSFIMAAYEPDRNWLNEAVHSVLAQDAIDVEVILVDDGSTTPIHNVLPSLDEPRLSCFRIAHAGVSRARNHGIRAATGQWFRFVDADDLLPPRSTALLLEKARTMGQVVFGDTLICQEDLTPVGRMRNRLEGNVLLDCIEGRLNLHLGAGLFNRRIVEAVGPFDPELTLMEDFDFALRALAMSPMRSVAEVTYLYRRHERSVTAGADLERTDAAWRYVADRFFERHPQHYNCGRKRRIEAKRLLDGAEACLSAGRLSELHARLVRAASLAPLRSLRATAAILGRSWFTKRGDS